MKTVIEMALEARVYSDCTEWTIGKSKTFVATHESIQRFAELVRAEALAEQPAPQVVDCHTTGVCVQSGLRAEQPAPVQEPTDHDLMRCWVEKPSGEIDGIASMRAVLDKFGNAPKPAPAQPAQQEPELERFAKLVRADERRAMMQLFTDPENQPTQHGTVTLEYIQREIAAEREACAKVCDDAFSSSHAGRIICNNLAAAIRARSNT